MHEIVNPDDVGMRQFEAAFGFAPELIKRRTIVDHQIGKKFQRDIALQLFVSRQPDNSHSASPEDLDQRVTAKNFLSAGKLTRSRGYSIACAFRTHFEQVYIINLISKLKAGMATATTACSDSCQRARALLVI
jgi:hypothetical protein